MRVFEQSFLDLPSSVVEQGLQWFAAGRARPLYYLRQFAFWMRPLRVAGNWNLS
jgi:hypothetical protein